MNGKGLNKKSMESLIKSGALDDLGKTRATLYASFEEAMNYYWNAKKDIIPGQISMLDIINSGKKEEDKKEFLEEPEIYKEMPEFSNFKKLMMEKEMLGIYISGHPIQKFSKTFEKMKVINSNIFKQNENKWDGKAVTYIGLIESINRKQTKKGNIITFLNMSDNYGNLKIVVFENVFKTAENIIKENSVICIKGKLDMKIEGNESIIANNIIPVKIKGKDINELL